MITEKRLIDANAIENGIALYVAENAYLNDTALDALEMAWKWVNKAPTLDAVEVVRCGDCKYWKPTGSMMGDSIDTMEPIGGCPLARFCRKASDFCSKGERRSDA